MAYLFEVLGQEAKMIQITGDVKTTGAETIPISVNLLVRNVLPCDDMLFSSERPLTIERVLYLKGKMINSFYQSYPGWWRL